MDDEKIIELYYARDERAIDYTELKYGGRCRTLSYNILSSLEDSEECINDTYLAAWEAIPPAWPEHLGAYILGIARKLSLMCLRRRCADRRGGGEYALCFDELGDVLPDSKNPERELEIKELGGEIQRFISRLSPEDRKIFMCRYWLITPVGQIAESLGCTESRVKSSLHRSRTKLKKHLAKEGLL